jgi:hypothetical protein
MIDDHIALVSETSFAQTADKCAVVSLTVWGQRGGVAAKARRFGPTGIKFPPRGTPD